MVVYSISVQLAEFVVLARGFNVLGMIWQESAVGAVETGNIRIIREYLGDYVDKFINDYLAANPK
jgi:hypothetical protein